MNESFKRNNKYVAASIWCMVAVVAIGIVLRIIEMAGGQFMPITSIIVSPYVIRQIPLIPRAIDAILVGMIWAVTMALMKNQEDEELGSFAVVSFVLGLISILLDGTAPGRVSILSGILEGFLIAISVLLLAYIWKKISRGTYPRINACIFIAVGYLLGIDLIYAFANGVIFGVLVTIASSITAVATIASAIAIAKILVPEKKPVEEAEKETKIEVSENVTEVTQKPA